MATWTIGSVTVTRIEEQLGVTAATPEQYFRGFERDVLQRHLDWVAPDHYDPQRDRFVTSIHSWLIRANGLTVLLVDPALPPAEYAVPAATAGGGRGARGH
jgi:hypothetical protein